MTNEDLTPLLTSYPHSSVFYRKLNRSFPKIVRGKGCWLYDDKGKAYLDAVGGAFVANLGHGNKRIADAIGKQAGKIAYVNGTAFTHEPAEALAEEITKLNPKGMDKVYFLSSGSEAVEAALKLARQYWCEMGKPEKTKIITASPGYHGNTLLALSASARGHYKTFFKPWLVKMPVIPAPYPYCCECRNYSKTPSPKAGIQRRDLTPCPVCSGDILEEVLLKEDPKTVAAFIIEPVGGSSTGASVPGPGYHRKIREICDRHEVLFIADEVLTGAGRTGTWTALETYGVIPDIFTLGKGISGGCVALSAVVTSRKILDVIANKSGALMHAQTFSHHPVSCAAGLAAVRELRKRRLIERSAKMGKILHKKLTVLLDLPFVGDVRGKGLLAGVEFVKSKDSREPFPRKLKFADTLVQNAQDLGLVLWPNMGQADGVNGDLVMIAPPFIIMEAEIDEIVRRLKSAIELTTSNLRLT
ncbi:MAG: aspartate aminotransferase family protein [Elusimicrobia bacterium]|nr:aspartate aminotransferase family protein [Elusimicrobiota bacterium]